MSRALHLARTHLGQTWPNPSVGAVIVKDGRVIGEGCTQKGGRPHAETEALKNIDARGATLYVTLEPCAHHGATPPCADAIIAAGVATVVIACRDPHPGHGGGIEKLRAAGIEVIEGICKEEARELNRGFFSVVEKGRPYVALKIAASKDGKIAGGPSRWITGPESRAEVHRLRSEFDAVLTGIGTVLADDPLLTVRLPGLEGRSPVRVVLDRQGRLPDDSKLARTAKEVPVWRYRSPVEDTLRDLARRCITRVLVEAGQALNTAFLQSGLADRIYRFTAPETLGNQGLSAVQGELAEMLAPYRKLRETTAFGPDTLAIYEKQ